MPAKTWITGERLRASDLNTVAAQAFAAYTQLATGSQMAGAPVLATGSTTARTLGARFAEVFNVLDFGAVGDNATDDTDALQAALDAVPAAGGVVVIPAGYVFRYSAPLVAKAKTTITGGGKLRALGVASWSGGAPYHGIKNENWAESDITDEGITIEGVSIDHSALGAIDGTEHVIWIQRARRVRVRDCHIVGGASSVALLGCDDTLIEANALLEFYNCGADHWRGPRNARVLGNFLKTSGSAQMANFNPDPTDLSAGYEAVGFVFDGNILVSEEADATPCQFEPLAAGNSVRGVVIGENTFINVRLVLRGDTVGVGIDTNYMAGFTGDDEAITSYALNGGSPAAFAVRGNIIRDPLTALANVGVLRFQMDSAVIDGNIIMGTSYAAAAITGNANLPVVGANFIEKDTANGAERLAGVLRSPIALRNGAATYYGFTTTNGYHPRWRCQSDNNLVLVGIGAGGVDRPLLACFQESDTAAMRVGASVNFEVQALAMHTPATLAATGTTIGTAAAITATCTRVTSCVAGVSDGVVLSPVVGAVFEVINETADTLKVYPNNSGTAEIDAGGASVPVTIAAGKAKAFRCAAAGQFRTVAAVS